MSNHTPAPREIVQTPCGVQIEAGPDDARVFVSGLGLSISRPNQILIASAPKLLEALEKLADACGNSGSARIRLAKREAREVIARARGEQL